MAPLSATVCMNQLHPTYSFTSSNIPFDRPLVNTFYTQPLQDTIHTQPLRPHTMEGNLVVYGWNTSKLLPHRTCPVNHFKILLSPHASRITCTLHDLIQLSEEHQTRASLVSHRREVLGELRTTLRFLQQYNMFLGLVCRHFPCAGALPSGSIGLGSE